MPLTPFGGAPADSKSRPSPFTVQPLPSFPGVVNLLVLDSETGAKVADLHVIAGDYTTNQVIAATRAFCLSLVGSNVPIGLAHAPIAATAGSARVLEFKPRD